MAYTVIARRGKGHPMHFSEMYYKRLSRSDVAEVLKFERWLAKTYHYKLRLIVKRGNTTEYVERRD